MTQSNSTATLFGGLLLAATVVLPMNAKADTARIEVGILNCQVEGGSGFIFGSSKALSCRFERPGEDEFYTGQIKKFGIDIGTTSAAVISWAVLAPTTEIEPGALAGSYAGVSAEATAGLGVGANALIGGSARSLALQPLSIGAQKGLNISAGIAELELFAN